MSRRGLRREFPSTNRGGNGKRGEGWMFGVRECRVQVAALSLELRLYEARGGVAVAGCRGCVSWSARCGS